MFEKSYRDPMFEKAEVYLAILRVLRDTLEKKLMRILANVGEGHLYQGTYKSFPVQDDDPFYSVCRYVERNALRANLVQRAEDWCWGSLWQRRQRARLEDYPPLSDWPLNRPRDWTALVNRPPTEAEVEALRTSVTRGRPFGAEAWQKRTAKRLGLESTFRSRGRPKRN